ncbi:MAG: hypothetical protein KAJ51_08050 [Thermoplasmata archaeon]|nr:hypothetical protein [Thermoplasmata archaeon]
MKNLTQKEVIFLINDDWKPVKEIRKDKYEYCYLIKNGQKIYAGPWDDEYEKIWLERIKYPYDTDQFLPMEKQGSSSYHERIDNSSEEVNNPPLATTEELSGELSGDLSEKQDLLTIDDHHLEPKKKEQSNNDDQIENNKNNNGEILGWIIPLIIPVGAVITWAGYYLLRDLFKNG